MEGKLNWSMLDWGIVLEFKYECIQAVPILSVQR